MKKIENRGGIPYTVGVICAPSAKHGKAPVFLFRENITVST